jgi:hypothetical protein
MVDPGDEGSLVRRQRLHLLIQDLDLQPMAFGFCLLQQNRLAVLLSCRGRISGTKRHSGPEASPEGSESVSEDREPKLILF